ncbi:MAG: serine/threonine protein kinase [Pirellulales bacterium]
MVRWKNFLREGNLPDVQKAIEFLVEIAKGLDFAHAKGVIHCDLKPANVLLDHSHQPRIADFGQGRMAGDHSPSLGTLFYMAPEQAEADAVPDVKWDVYSLGAIGYTLLVGSPPFRTPEATESLHSAESVADRLNRYRQVITSAPKPKHHYQRTGVDKSLAAIIDRCLQVDPKHRFQNVNQVIHALEQRNRDRSRRPLYILGLVGPILLMILMLMFSTHGRMLAVDRSQQSIIQRAIESNYFAAQYASRTLETELQSLYGIIESEAQRDDLIAKLSETNNTAQDTLKQIYEAKASPTEIEQFKQLDTRLQLERYLESRLQLLTNASSNTQSLLTSMFVDDLLGTNLAIVFRSESERESAVSPVGRNYAYRSYFNDQRDDGLPSDDPSKFHITKTTKLSAVYRSTSSGTGKIAISTPIWRQGEDHKTAEPIGVLVISISLGNFRLLSEANDDEKRLNRFAVLFDGREGNQRGTILQHPYISSIDRERMMKVLMPQLSVPVIESLVKEGIEDYADPCADFADGQAYEGKWIACVSQVDLPNSAVGNTHAEKSDLWIIVQERLENVAAPIEALATRLQREIMVEFTLLMGIVMTMWYFVFRLGKQSGRADRWSRSGKSESISAAAATVAERS